MRISWNWLRERVDIDTSPEELAHLLTMAGFEVEDIEDWRDRADGVVVGKIVECEPHPNADKLRVCQVDIGGESPSNIVCGAPNARTDIYVPVATLGTYLPAVDLKIKPAKLRGVKSEGMICSLSELGLEKDSEGIYIFGDGESENNFQVGDDARPLLGLDDRVLDLTSTANRADALSMVGVAREVAALTRKTVRLPEVSTVSLSPSDALKLNIAEAQSCPTYIATVIENVTIAPSPDWLKHRLQAAGVRPINNVVDITNYILLEWGQPLHAFDRDRLQNVAKTDDLTMGVRFAKEGETFTTLDSQKRKLQSQTLLITANDTPVALAGVMGGEDTEVSDTTTNLVLEAALFDPVAIRRSARTQGLRTEASARYERGVNFAELELASDRAISLICDIAGGKAVSQQIFDDRPDFSRTLELRIDRVRQLLGKVKIDGKISDIPTEDMRCILVDLGFEVSEKSATVWQVKVPAYRYRDIEREIDLIEEIARLYGYDNFCDTLPSQGSFGYLSTEYYQSQQVREAFRAAGLTELVHYSLVKPEAENQVVISNPLFAEYSALRTEMLSGLIEAFTYNWQQGNGALNGFELGRVFAKNGDKFYEKDAIAGILGGDPRCGIWTTSGKERPLSWYEAKGILESAFDRLGVDVSYQTAKTSDDRLHPGRTAELKLQGKTLGIFGQLHPQLCRDREFPDEVYVFQLELDLLLQVLAQPSKQVPRFQAYSTYPASDRDLALFAPEAIAVSQLQATMEKAGGKLLESVQLFDEYKGENVPAGSRSLAFRLTYRADDRTLKDKEVDTAHQKVRKALTDKFEVELRS